MKKASANQVCKLWNDNFTGYYEPTKTHAVVCKSEGGINGGYSVEVHPCREANNGFSFHSIEAVTDIERAFKVSAYITQDEENKLIARIF